MHAGTQTEMLVRPTELAHEATLRALRALDENSRLAWCQMVAIERYVDTMERFLAVGRGGGPPLARRRATAVGLRRLKEYLTRRMSEAAQRRATGSSEQDSPLEREQL
jgi:hypothetical protein